MSRLPRGRAEQILAANRTTPQALLDILPPWFRVKARWRKMEEPTTAGLPDRRWRFCLKRRASER